MVRGGNTVVPCSWVENQIHIIIRYAVGIIQIYIIQCMFSKGVFYPLFYSAFINAKFHDPYSGMDHEICSKLRLEYPNAMIGALIGGRGLQVCAAGACQHGIMTSGKFFDTTFPH